MVNFSRKIFLMTAKTIQITCPGWVFGVTFPKPIVVATEPTKRKVLSFIGIEKSTSPNIYIYILIYIIYIYIYLHLCLYFEIISTRNKRPFISLQAARHHICISWDTEIDNFLNQTSKKFAAHIKLFLCEIFKVRRTGENSPT